MCVESSCHAVNMDSYSSTQQSSPDVGITSAHPSQVQRRTASGDADVVSFRSGTQNISRLVKAGGAVGAIGYVGLCAYCLVSTIRDKEAALLGIPSSMISLDVRDAVLPGALAAAFLMGPLLVAMLVPTVAYLGPPRLGDSASRKLFVSLKSRLAAVLERTKLLRPLPSSTIQLLRPMFALVCALLVFSVGPAAAVLVGDIYWSWYGNRGHEMEVVLNANLCPPGSTDLASRRELCVLVGRGEGQLITRWIDVRTGELSSVAKISPDPGAGYASVTTRFPAVRSANPLDAR